VKTAIVTGAYGFIGRHLAYELGRQGVLVSGLGHGNWLTSQAKHWGVRHWLSASVESTSLELLKSQTHPADVVFHLAGGSSVGASLADPCEDFRRTVTTTVELLDWVRRSSPATKVVLVSSAAVYGNSHHGPVAENSDLSPYSPYGVHKRMMEEIGQSYVANYGLSVIALRLFSVYGEHLRKQLLWDLCAKLCSGASCLTLGGTGGELRDWTAVSDVVGCLIGSAKLDHQGFRVINIGTGTASPVRHVAERIAESWRALGGQTVSMQFTGKSRPGDPFCLVADCSRLEQLGLHCMQPLDHNLDRYVRWFRDTMARDF
jgi:UDP-glucose 4-epimerase